MYYSWDKKTDKITKLRDVLEFGRMFEDNEARRVDYTVVGDAHVSTVFLGLDHGFEKGKKPVLFETMVFGGYYDEEQERYCTAEEARMGHAKWVKRVKALKESKPRKKRKE